MEPVFRNESARSSAELAACADQPELKRDSGDLGSSPECSPKSANSLKLSEATKASKPINSIDLIFSLRGAGTMTARRLARAALITILIGISWREAAAQTNGVDLHNIAQPASGGMAGVSLARPQDAPSALFGNPATMTQYAGTTFTTGLSWLDPNVKTSHDGTVTSAFGGGPYSGTSSTQGFLVPSIAALQDLRALGIAGTAGVGLTSGSGLGTSFRQLPNSVGTSAEYLVYSINFGLGVEIAENLSFGAAATLGMGILDAGLAQTAAMTHAFAARGTFGFTYVLPSYDTTIGLNYQTRMPFRFDNFQMVGPGVYSGLNVEQPDNFGLGLSNQSLCEGNLLLAVDVLYKQWQGADFWRDYFQNQWVFALGAQYTQGQWKYRAGYAFAGDPINKNAGAGSGVVQQLVTQYLQGTELPAISKHRLTAGLGYCNILPGLSVDGYAGGLLPQSEDFGTHTHTTAFAWYLGVGLTWAFYPASADPAPQGT
jgi:long-chain fatty acid transport protein